jgi:hypothetical protein
MRPGKREAVTEDAFEQPGLELAVPTEIGAAHAEVPFPDGSGRGVSMGTTMEEVACGAGEAISDSKKRLRCWLPHRLGAAPTAMPLSRQWKTVRRRRAALLELGCVHKLRPI